MLWLVAILMFMLIPASKRIMGKYKWGQKVWFLPTVFLFLAVSSLVWAPLPFGWGSLASVVGLVLGLLLGLAGTLFGTTGAVVAAVLLFGLIILGLIDLLVDKKPDGVAKTAIIAVPFLAFVASGPIAAQVVEITGSVSEASTAAVSNITQ